MKKELEVRLPHGLDQAEVRRRLDHGLARARTEFADKVTAIDAAWETDERLTLELTVMGMSIAGDVDVLPAELVVRLDLPMMAGLFAGRIRSGIEERLGGMLEAPA
ncbi:MAG: polyhydroxyalkanoic acid system family protein [Planctomycetota bacterium]